MRRLAYLNWTVVMLAVAYVLLRLIAKDASSTMSVFPDGWQFLDPFRLITLESDRSLMSLGVHLLLTCGLVITAVKRARNAGWRPWIGALMFLPVVRLFLFVVLAVIPSARHTDVLNMRSGGWLDRILPRSKAGNAFAAIGLTLALVLPLGFVNVRVLEDYGSALFIALPFLLGSLSAYLYNHYERRTYWQSIGIAMLTTTMVLGLIFVLAMEGVICLIMAAPIIYAIALVGALIGHAIANESARQAPAMTLVILLAPSLMAFETIEPQAEPLFKVVTAVRINAPAQRVWNSLVTFSHMKDPEELIFRVGISYPIEARITGTGVGACRYCQFNTGAFVEPITTWDEPRLLAFNVDSFPPPMTELSIYEKVNAPHIRGFFRSHHGQFRLGTLPDGSTLLEGTTWYTHAIWPTWYWRWWSDSILHRIHGRVLEHIRSQAEG